MLWSCQKGENIILGSISLSDIIMFLSLYKTSVWPHLEFFIAAWSP